TRRRYRVTLADEQHGADAHGEEPSRREVLTRSVHGTDHSATIAPGGAALVAGLSARDFTCPERVTLPGFRHIAEPSARPADAAPPWPLVNWQNWQDEIQPIS